MQENEQENEIEILEQSEQSECSCLAEINSVLKKNFDGGDYTYKILIFRPDTRKKISKRLHDINGSLRTLQLASKAIQSGYQFNDNKAQAKIDAIMKAIGTLERETLFLRKLYS
ncbi:MAG: hypothetical protein HY537_11650 [Deltaproteobacteria bacterium]|nr:hypothetical protein [Deltaproteobacteria bacterium]